VLGVDGLVCSPEEAAALRKIVGHQMNLVTPGIRPAGASAGDQKRIMTPARAIPPARIIWWSAGPCWKPPIPGPRRTASRRDRAGAGLANKRENADGKGYWIARVDVHNMDGYKDYVAQNGAVFNKYGAKFLVRGAGL